jgi:hypothetical protein
MRRTLAVLCSVAPFVAAGIAAFGARHDPRMIWMALVATVVARLVGPLFPRTPRPVAISISIAVGTIAASVVALVAGARAPFGVIAVALVLAGFATAGAWLNAPRRAARGTDRGAVA